MLRMRILVCLALVVAFVADVRANGRPPATSGVYFRPGHTDSIVVRSTFGLLVSRDAGCSFRWVCEQAIGYGGTYDPKYAIARDGSMYATTFNGLRVSRDGGCSWATATLPSVWVDSLDVGPNGDVWVGSAQSTVSNALYRSTDNGVTFEPRGALAPTILWKSIKVAPSDPLRVYTSGFELATEAEDAMGAPRAHLYASPDAGSSWQPLALGALQFGASPTVMVVAVHPSDASHLYIVTVGSHATTGDRLYRSIDGGMTFVEVLATTEAVRDVVFRDAATVLVVAGGGGTYRSDDSGQTFFPVEGAPKLACLGEAPDRTLVGCATNWEPDFMSVGESTDAVQWTKLFRFVELAGPLKCPAGTPVHDTCDQQLWSELQEQFGATGPKDPACAIQPLVDTPGEAPKQGGCCNAATLPDALLPSVWVLALLLRTGRRHGVRRRDARRSRSAGSGAKIAGTRAAR